MADDNLPRVAVILGKNVKAARNKLGLSQQKLADQCNLSTTYIAEIEIGRKFPSARSLQIIADALALKPYQLFFENDNWQKFDRYHELADLLAILKKSVNEEITHVIQTKLKEAQE
ncbi:helix-turn-helix domain-containing protein [Spirochaeta africana]|uniref:Putative transcriptional regulator with C-terminal CBS domains n=1 Tax=Spirochaeta africana (strain ATCC 700263 / DSM 8902 / Z-7692) TaxID=889378 RepID=H9UIU0_SPIAZ|nr:helix-turn-helix transcriptional regulator [Spirochaeta africana]AFG37433.1 putative transcriptional regulator with C-terminal CBS domains [Spirochaeta africana DSM 8902]